MSYPDGAPCWVQLLTRDADGAQRFYAELFGWECRDQGGWAAAYLGDRPIGAITPSAEASDPPAWTVYLRTSDIAASAARVEAAGGQIVEGPFNGYVLAKDPGGATFALWEPGPPGPAGAWAEPGAVSWAEVNAPDGKAADAFYGSLFAYDQRQVPGGIDYTTYHVGGEPVCGRLQMDEHWAGVPPHWMVYFDVANLAEATAKVTALGGAVPVPPFDSPFGRIAVISHPAAGFSTLRQPPA